MMIIYLQVSTNVMDLVAVFAVFALFVFMLSLLCFCVLPFSSVNKDLYNAGKGAGDNSDHLVKLRCGIKDRHLLWPQ